MIPQFVNIAAATPRQTKPERVTACITGLYIKIGDILRSCEHNVPYEVLDVRGDEVDMIARCSVDPGLKSGDAIMLSAPKKPVRYILAYPSNDSIMKRQKAGLLHSRVSVK